MLDKITNKINTVVANVGLKRFVKGHEGKKTTKKPNLIKEVMDQPENFIFEASIENEEILIKVKRKEI